MIDVMLGVFAGVSLLILASCSYLIYERHR
jgi:hypothetical protein